MYLFDFINILVIIMKKY